MTPKNLECLLSDRLPLILLVGLAIHLPAYSANAGNLLSLLKSKPTCPDLLAPPITSEERIADFYVKLLDEYRRSLGDETKYAAALEVLARGGSTLDLPYPRSAPAQLQNHFRQIAAIETSGKLPQGGEIDRESLRAHLQKRITEEMKAVAVRTREVTQTQKVRVLARPILEQWRYLKKISRTADPKYMMGLTSDADLPLLIWDTQTGKPIRQIYLGGLSGEVSAVEISTDFTRALTSSSQSARVWDLTSGALLCERRFFMPHEVSLPSHDSARSLGWEPGSENPIQVWDMKTGKNLFPLEKSTSRIYGLHANRDYTRAVALDQDALSVWDLETGKRLVHRDLIKTNYYPVTVDAKFKQALTATHEGVIRVFDLESGLDLYTLQVIEPSEILHQVYPNADFTRLIGKVHANTLSVWDLPTGTLLHELRGHTNNVIDVKTNADFTRALSVGRDQKIILWNLETGEKLAESSFSGLPYPFQVSADFKWAFFGQGESQKGKIYQLDLELFEGTGF